MNLAPETKPQRNGWCMRHTLADVEIELQHEPPRPASAELRTLYRDESEGPRKRATRQGLWIAVAAYLLYSLTDILVVPDVAVYTLSLIHI